MNEIIKNEIQKIFKNHELDREFIPGKSKIPLAAPSFGADEVEDALESMLTTWVTMGDKVRSFEEKFQEYVNSKNAIMVNSGSSANLLALSILTNPLFEDKIERGSSIITPAVTWATTVSPIVNVGCEPLFVDVDLDTLCINTDLLEDAISEKTSCIMPVHLMGHPCDTKKISKLALEKNLRLVEDSCEAHGASIEGKKVGTFGDIGTFSFFMSHHITTMEGGMLVTDNENIAEIGKSLRTFGWTREMEKKKEINEKYSHIDPRFLFVNLGYNLRPTELQGAFGRHQIKKLDSLIQHRRETARYWNERLMKYSDNLLLPTRNLENHVFFGYAITITENAPFSRKEMTDFLELKGIETRPIMSGNFTEQPVSKLLQWKKHDELKNSKLIMRNSFFIGNHLQILEKEREYVADTFDEFFKQQR
jgi:CDP-6-deoxy-D-xylo-4-hexulose-3-dehydrase